MKMFRKVLSLALVLTMLATCAVSGLVTARAEGAEKIIDSDPASSKGIFTANAGLSGTNLRIIRGTFDGVFLGDASNTYNITDNVTSTCVPRQRGQFQEI